MTYLQDFQTQIAARNFSKFLQLWEEYCTNEKADVEEFKQLLVAIKNSDLAKSFGKIVETAIPLWKTIENKEESYAVLKLLIDLETTNTPALSEIAFQALKEKYGNDSQFNERIRIVGLRTKDNFQSALSNYDLLNHMEKGRYVYHSSGWGTGEVCEVSTLRQQVGVEFENVPGRKQLTFENAFRTLIPLPNEHFFSRRFSNPDLLEKEAKENPVQVIRSILADLGPKTASEIKDLLCETVIPEEEWSKWWSATRSKLKKDPIIDSPNALKDPFSLRKEEITHEERLQKAITHKTDIDEIIQAAYALLRDLPNLSKHPEIRDSLKEKLMAQLSNPALTPEQELQICICLENQFGQSLKDREAKDLIQKLEDIENVLNSIEIIGLKKRTLALVKDWRTDWEKIFLKSLFTIKHSAIRDYLLKELNKGESKKRLEKSLQDILHHPEKAPEFFIWYLQELLEEDAQELPYGNKEGQCQFFESLFVLLNRIENRHEQRDLVKKIYNLISGKRYAVVRQVLEGADLKYAQEFLLLASKCQTLSIHDKQILRSLAAVVHPEIGKDRSIEDEHKANIIWTTEEAYLKIQDKIRQIGTVEIVENAKEVEAARALGDLRENSEYKFAVERRSRLQGQLKTLSDEIKRARIITKNDLTIYEVAIGSVVEISDSQGKVTVYTILGPWDANADENILSFQSKFAQAMMGSKKGETFEFKDEKYIVKGLSTFLT